MGCLFVFQILVLPKYHLATLHHFKQQTIHHKPQEYSPPGTARLNVSCVMPQLHHLVGTLLGPFRLQWSVTSPIFSTSLALVRYFPAVCSLVSPICHSPPGRSGRRTQSGVTEALRRAFNIPRFLTQTLKFRNLCLSLHSTKPYSFSRKAKMFHHQEVQQLSNSWLQSSILLAGKIAH